MWSLASSPQVGFLGSYSLKRRSWHLGFTRPNFGPTGSLWFPCRLLPKPGGFGRGVGDLGSAMVGVRQSDRGPRLFGRLQSAPSPSANPRNAQAFGTVRNGVARDGSGEQCCTPFSLEDPPFE